MEKEENVYDGIAQTGESAGAQLSENVLAVLGKFKSVDALARAYGALEAEFTRRSQRLKELEKSVDNSQLEKESAAVGAEKLRKHAKERKEAAKAFDEFVSSVNTAHIDEMKKEGEPIDGFKDCKTVESSVAAQENAEISAQASCLENEAKEGDRYALKEENTLTVMPVGEGNAAELGKELAQSATPFLNKESGGAEAEEVKGRKVFPAVAKHGNTEVSSEELYRRVSRDEGVRLKIIGEYLASIKKSGAPLTASGVGMPVSPPLKAKNIGDAGIMALQYFKQPYQN